MNCLNGVAYNLAKIDWLLTCHFTWEFDSRVADTDFSEQRRKEDLSRLLGSTCGRFKLRIRNLAYYHKTEWGKSLRGHCHLLLARHGTKNVAPELLASDLKESWLKYGIAVIEPFDKKRHWEAVSYSSKTEKDANGHPRFHPEYFSPALKTLLLRLKDASPANSISSFTA